MIRYTRLISVFLYICELEFSFVTFMLTVSGLIQGLAEVLVHYPGDLAHVVGVEDDVPGQVLSRPLQLLLAIALPANFLS